MAAEWPLVLLGDVTDVLTGFPFASARYIDDPDAPRLLRGDNIVQGALRWDGAKRWPAEAVDAVADYALHDGDVVIAMDRPWIEAGLKYATLRPHDLPALLVQRVARLRGTARLHTPFLQYVVGGRAFTHHVLSVQTGTTVPHISGTQIKQFSFRLPSVSEQEAIARILGALDDKIQLNGRTSETLEAMAQALFKSWFVDFDPVRGTADGRDLGLPKKLARLFPSTMEDSEMGEVPRGWEVRGLDSLARFVNGVALQKYPATDGRALPVIKIAQLRAGSTAGADLASADIDPDFVVHDGDVVFSWSGSLMCTIWAGGTGALNQHLFKVSSTEHPKWLYYLWIQRHLADFRHIAAGKATTMGHIQRHHLSDAKVVVPPRELVEALDVILGPLLEGSWRRLQESRTLAALRDTLLPRLISGELRVPDAERIAVGAGA